MSVGTEQRPGSDVDPARRADVATVHAFLNCYLRETSEYEVHDDSIAGVEPGVGGLLRANLSAQDVHLLIGPPEYLGDGCAAPLLEAVVAMQFRHPDTDRVIAEPDARNERALTVFEQCGFEPQSEFQFEEADKDAVLLVCERERFETEVLAEPTETSTRANTQGVSR